MNAIVGSLVTMKGDPHNVRGIVTKVHRTNHNLSVRVVWLDDLCDPLWVFPENLDVISESR